MREPPNLQEVALRRFESEALDGFHKSLPLFARSKDHALRALLAAYDGLLVTCSEIKKATGEPEIGTVQRIKLLYESLNVGLHRLLAGCDIPPLVTSCQSEEIEEAGSFFLPAANYVLVSSFHILYSRGLVTAEVDEERKIVRFLRPRSNNSRQPWFGFADSMISIRFSLRPSRGEIGPALEEMDAFLLAQAYRTGREGLKLDNVSALLHPSIIQAVDLTIPRETVPVPAETELCGFTMAQFRLFWRGLFAWSFSLSRLYLQLVYSGLPQEHCLPTQVLPRWKFIDNLCKLTGLEERTIDAIVERLTYNARDLRSDIILQPLICDEHSVTWSCLSIIISGSERNMLKLMSRLDHLRDAAASIIGNREKYVLRRFGLLLAKRGQYNFSLNRTVAHVGCKAEIDLLAYKRKIPEEVLLVECKAILAVDSPSEVISATRSLERAREQLCRATEILKAAPISYKQSLYPFVDWARVSSYWPIILTPESQPGADFDETVAPVVSLLGLEAKVRNRDLQSPGNLWVACKQKRWLVGVVDPGECYSSVTIGPVTYEFPTFGDSSE